MNTFLKAKTVRLRGHNDKYLVAEDDKEGVSQDRKGSSRQAKWSVEIVESSKAVRLKSCYDRYLTASNVPFLLGMTGLKVLQTLPRRLDSSLEWTPVSEGVLVRLKTPYGQYLRANGGPPPWRNSVTHDVPHRTAHQDWVLWDVEIVEVRPASPERRPVPPVSSSSSSVPSYAPSASPVPPGSSSSSSAHSYAPSASSRRHESLSSDVESPPPSPPARAPIHSAPAPGPVLTKQESLDYIPQNIRRPDGRLIQYRVAGDRGEVDEDADPSSFEFHGTTVEQLTEKLKEVTEMDDIIVCTRSMLNEKLYPLRLHLPPNNAAMNVVIVPATSRVAKSFSVPPVP